MKHKSSFGQVYTLKKKFIWQQKQIQGYLQFLPRPKIWNWAISQLFLSMNDFKNHILLKNKRTINILNMLKLVSTIFYQSFVFPQSDSSSKTMKSVFYFIKKSPFCSHYIQTFVIFSLAFHTSQIQKNNWKWNNLWCHELACITNITNKEIFLNFFRNLKSNWALAPGPFCFWLLCSLKGTGFERKNKVDFLRVFDNPLWKHLTFKRISCMQWLFWIIYQN